MATISLKQPKATGVWFQNSSRLNSRARAGHTAAGAAGILRRAIMACRKGGTISIPGVYGGVIDKMPMGAGFGKSLTFKKARLAPLATCAPCSTELRTAISTVRS